MASDRPVLVTGSELLLGVADSQPQVDVLTESDGVYHAPTADRRDVPTDTAARGDQCVEDEPRVDTGAQNRCASLAGSGIDLRGHARVATERKRELLAWRDQVDSGAGTDQHVLHHVR